VSDEPPQVENSYSPPCSGVKSSHSEAPRFGTQPGWGSPDSGDAASLSVRIVCGNGPAPGKWYGAAHASHGSRTVTVAVALATAPCPSRAVRPTGNTPGLVNRCVIVEAPFASAVSQVSGNSQVPVTESPPSASATVPTKVTLSPRATDRDAAGCRIAAVGTVLAEPAVSSQTPRPCVATRRSDPSARTLTS
jgi:hypothetical protein